MVKKFNLFLVSILVAFLFLFGLVLADSNGVWILAKDIRGGTFGLDEQDVSSGIGFTFVNQVNFNDQVNMNLGLNVTGEIYQNGQKLANLDENGKVPLEQLPFHKGVLLAPENRPIVSGLTSYNVDYFSIADLGISGNIVNNVLEGITFGPNNELVGGFSKSNICDSAGIGGTANCGVTSEIGFGTTYVQVNPNSASSISYCNQIDIQSNSLITSTIIQTADLCKKIDSCTSSSQIISNYSDGVSCGSNMICDGGICVINLAPNPSCYGQSDSCRDYLGTYKRAWDNKILPFHHNTVYNGINFAVFYILSGDEYTCLYNRDLSTWHGCGKCTSAYNHAKAYVGGDC